MKQILSIFFLSIYLISSIGVFGELHFCKGKLESIGFGFAKAENCCKKMSSNAHCCAIMQKKDDCCDDQFFVAQVDTEHLISTAKLKLFPPLTTLPADLDWKEIETSNDTCNIISNRLEPPPDLPLFLTYCSFLFYG